MSVMTKLTRSPPPVYMILDRSGRSLAIAACLATRIGCLRVTLRVFSPRTDLPLGTRTFFYLGAQRERKHIY